MRSKSKTNWSVIQPSVYSRRTQMDSKIKINVTFFNGKYALTGSIEVK